MPALRGVRTPYLKSRKYLASTAASLASTLRPWRARLARQNRHRIFAVDVNNAKLGFFASLSGEYLPSGEIAHAT